MKIRYLLILPLLLMSLFLQAQPHTARCHHSQHKHQLQPLSVEQKMALMASVDRSDTFNILDYDITLEVIDFTNRRIKGYCDIQFEALMANQSILPLDLMDMQLDSVVGPNGPLTFSYDSLLLEVNFPTALVQNDTMTIRVYYQGTPTPDPSWGGFKFDGPYAYNLGIGLNSNPYNMGRSWFPCFDNFVERATVGLNIITKLPNRAYGIGTFLGESVVSGDTILRQYRMSQAVTTYITSVGVSNYAQVDYTHQTATATLPMQLVARVGDTTAMYNTFVELGDAVDAIESWYGPYWWERVGYIATPQGAMEHPTNIAYPVGIATGGNTASHKRLMAHELGHCWWGDVVTLRTANDMWIKEGNAEYTAHLFTEYTQGHEAFINQVKANHLNVLRRAHFEDNGFQQLSGIPFEHVYGMHTYEKGAAMLHNMRGFMGDSLFRAGQTAVLNTHQYSALSGPQYRDALEAETGFDMDPYFDAWIFQPGFGAYEVNQMNVTNNGGSFDVELVIEHKLRAANNYFQSIPLTITFMDQNWQKETKTVLVSGQLDTVNLTLGFDPMNYVVNADNKFNLAQLYHEAELSGPASNLSLGTSETVLNVTALADSAVFAVEHFWVAPDPIVNNPNNAQISSTHYWRVSGTFDESMQASLRFDYNGSSIPRLDQDLVGTTEDSLILVYRPGSTYDWREYGHYTKLTLFNSTDGQGIIRLDTVVKGEYAFANGTLDQFVISTEQLPKVNNIKLYPNPASDYLFVEGTLARESTLNLELYDLNGKLIQTQQNQFQHGAFLQQMDLRDLPAGVYWLKLSDEKGVLIDTQAVGIVD
jgi:hypothetical protein